MKFLSFCFASYNRYEVEDSEIQKMISLLGGSKEERVQALVFFQNLKNKYLCSGSSIKIHISKLKRFLYNEGYKFELTDELVNKYKER